MRLAKLFLILVLPAVLLSVLVVPSFAQRPESFDQLLEEIIDQEATKSAEEATQSAEKKEEDKKIAELKEQDPTRVEEEERRKEILNLFAKRKADTPTATNFIAYATQYSVINGVPANTAVLVMLLPLLATLVLFFRHVVGVPSLAMILPIALSITLVATGLAAGLILLGTIILASTLARIVLKKIRIVQLSKVTLTMVFVSIAILITLTITAQLGVLAVRQISIFPVLLLVLLSQNIIELQTDRSFIDILKISAITISLGILGYFILASEAIRNFVLLYPETILLLIPVNILIGRYFGLRITEYIRFSPITKQWQ